MWECCKTASDGCSIQLVELLSGFARAAGVPSNVAFYEPNMYILRERRKNAPLPSITNQMSIYERWTRLVYQIHSTNRVCLFLLSGGAQKRIEKLRDILVGHTPSSFRIFYIFCMRRCVCAKCNGRLFKWMTIFVVRGHNFKQTESENVRTHFDGCFWRAMYIIVHFHRHRPIVQFKSEKCNTINWIKTFRKV